MAAKKIRKRPSLRVLVFLQGTVLMHAGAAGRTRQERVAQTRIGDPTVRAYASYVPVGRAAAKLQCWRRQGAQIDYLSSNRAAEAVAQDASVVQRCGFPTGRVLARGPGESYGEVAVRDMPDVLIEDDCESIGAGEITYPQVRSELRRRIKSIIVPEFGGIDHLPNSLKALLTWES